MPTSRVLLLLDDRLPATDQIRIGIDPALHAHVLTGSSVEEMATAVSSNDVEFIILGAGLPAARRQEMIEHLLSHGQGISIHLQPDTDGHREIIEFANGVLTGLAWHQWDWSRSVTAPESQKSTPPRVARPQRKRKNMIRRMWDYVFGRSDPPVRPPPPPYSPGAGF